MKRKILPLVLGTMMVLTLASCGKDDIPGHHFSDTYSFNEEKHWKECEDADCNQRQQTGVHVFGDWEIQEDSTCGQEGTKIRKCTVCDYFESQSIPLKDHNLADGWQQDEHSHWHKCLNNPLEKVDYQDHVLKYVYTKAGEKAATCEVDGYGHQVCEICNYELPSEVIKSTGHHWELDPNKESHYADCDGDGVIYFACSSCGATKTEVVPGGHSWNTPVYEWSEDNLSLTATTVCAYNASHVITETVSASRSKIAPTCDAEGLLTFTSENFVNSQFSQQVKNIVLAKCSDTLDHVTTAHKYDDGQTYDECTICHERYNVEETKAPMVKIDHMAIADYNPADTQYDEAADEFQFSVGPQLKLIPEKGVFQESVGKKYLALNIRMRQKSELCAWGPDLYIFLNEDKPGATKYRTSVWVDWTAGLLQNDIKVFDASTGKQLSNMLYKDRDIILVFNIESIEALATIGLKSDSMGTLKLNSVEFWETLDGHTAGNFVHHSSEAVDEYTGECSWDECRYCGVTSNYQETIPAAKVKIDLTDYATKTGDAEVTENSIHSNHPGTSVPQWLFYNIPERFVGKGKIFIKLRINAVYNGFDIRLGVANGSNFIFDLGQAATKPAGHPLNMNYPGVTVTTDDGLTTYSGNTATLLNHDITFTFDLSVGDMQRCNQIKFGLWYGDQTLLLKEAYYMDNCDHVGYDTATVVHPKTETVDGHTDTICKHCGQVVSSVIDYADRKDVELPENINMHKVMPGAEIGFSNIIEHVSPRNKVVLKFRFEKLNASGEYEYAADYATYIGLLDGSGNQLNSGLYYKSSSDVITAEPKIQLHSGNGGDARTLYRDAAATDGAYGILPSYIANSYDSATHIITWTIDLTDPIAQNLCGLNFRNSGENTRLHFFEAYQTK